MRDSSFSEPRLPNEEELAIDVEGLSKSFGIKRAVEEVSFSVKKGEVFGFLGPNGAGKTTTIKMLTTLIPPTNGRASILSYDLKLRERRFGARSASSSNKIVLIRVLTPRQVSVSTV